MKKQKLQWNISTLKERIASINFPEYQREPNVWALPAKQRLIDSIAREFDIGAMYFYEDDQGSIDCVDGRQRIGAILAFLGLDEGGIDNDYRFQVLNEIYQDETPKYQKFSGLSFAAIRDLESSDPEAREFVEKLLEYELTIIQLSEVGSPLEFNLQFARLNLGTIINSGEKLHAMVGDMRNVCFDDEGLGNHKLLMNTKIPTRRYATEQTSAQILAQAFSFEENSEFTRTRHFDLQKFFKAHNNLSSEERRLVDKVSSTMGLLHESLAANGVVLRNRAITVTVVLFAMQLGINDADSASNLARFFEEFLCRLDWQVKLGLDADGEYRYLFEFQKHLTQASVEKPAVKNRGAIVTEAYNHWLENGDILGDDAYRVRTGNDPNEECRGSQRGLDL